MPSPPGSDKITPQHAAGDAPQRPVAEVAARGAPTAELVDQLQGLALSSLGAGFGGFGACEPPPQQPQLSTSPTGSLASGSTISQQSVRSESARRPSLSGAPFLYGRLNESAPSFGSSVDARPRSGGERFAAAAAVVSSIDGFPAAHASIPGSVHGSFYGGVAGSMPDSGASTPQRFVGTIATADEPPTLPPAGESAFANYRNQTSSPGSVPSIAAGAGPQYDITHRCSTDADSRSGPIGFHANGHGSGIMGHSGSTPFGSHGSSPVQSEPLQQHSLHHHQLQQQQHYHQQRSLQGALGPVGRALQPQQQGHHEALHLAQQAAPSPALPAHPNPFPQYNMQQPSAGFYTGSYGSLAGPLHPQPHAGGGRAGGAPAAASAAAGWAAAPTWPPKEVSLNLNKAITKRLASATHYQQLLDIISDSAMYFDEVCLTPCKFAADVVWLIEGSPRLQRAQVVKGFV